MSWASIKEASSHYNVSIPTLRRWADDRIVPSRRTPTGNRQFKIQEINEDELGCENDRTIYIYVRVSSYKQRDDMERQKTFLSTQFPSHIIISDIGSGLNFKRSGFISLLEQIQTKSVGQIVVASRDRLCRFGFELVEILCQQHGSEILVLEHNDKSPEGELAADLLDIIQVFCCRRNGKRRYTNKMSQNKITPQTSSEKNTSTMVS